MGTGDAWNTGVHDPELLDGYFLRDAPSPAYKELRLSRPMAAISMKLYDRMGPYRAIDVTFDVSRDGEIVWSEYIEGRQELWQASLRQ